jgi:hypothetical protein
VWADRGAARRQGEAVARVAASEDGAGVTPLRGGPPAVVVTARVRTLRAVAAAAPGARAQLAVGGTRELCVVRGAASRATPASAPAAP